MLFVLKKHKDDAFIKQNVFKILKKLKKNAAYAKVMGRIMRGDPILRRYYFKLFGFDILVLLVIFGLIALMIYSRFFLRTKKR